MSIHITIERRVSASATQSQRVREVAAMFGLDADDKACDSIIIVPRTTITIEPGQVIFITGPSGGGKSAILDLIDSELRDRGVPAIDVNNKSSRPAENVPLIDAIPAPLEEALAHLSRAGLADAFVFLRSPSQLSEGQRARFELACAMLEADATRQAAVKHATTSCAEQVAVILADEFLATLDRITATIIARNVRKWITRTGHAFICATTHDDLLEHLQPDLVIHKDLGDAIELIPVAQARQAVAQASRQAVAQASRQPVAQASRL